MILAFMAVVAMQQPLPGGFQDGVETVESRAFTSAFIGLTQPNQLPIAVCKDDCVRGTLVALDRNDAGTISYRIEMSRSNGDASVAMNALTGNCTDTAICAQEARLKFEAAASMEPAVGAPAETPLGTLPTGVQLAPDCGGLYDLAGKAFCVTAPLSGMEAAGKGYIAHLEAEGWLVADGDDRRVVFVKRREAGGCDAMQMLAFYDRSLPDEATTPGYLAFSTIPGDACAALAAQTDQ